MDRSITIALDAMGGDNAPGSVVEGAALALRKLPELRFQFYGDNTCILPLLEAHERLKACSEVIHTDDVVSADAKPSIALRQGSKSSMRLAIDAVKYGRAEGVISAGNTGALMAMSKLVLRMLPNINRPAIATVLPTLKTPCVMLDLGANIDCDARTLCQFAVMGDAFARAVLGVASPAIGLLNVGEEEIKGHEALRNAYQTLRNTENLNFYGFVEGTDIGRGCVDVVVTDGFTGNIALKTMEGTAHFITSSLKQAFKGSWRGRLGYMLAASALAPFRQKMDPRQHNGGVFLGLNGITVKSHGNADAEAFAHAIGVTYELIAHDVNGKIIEELHNASLESAPLATSSNTQESPDAPSIRH